MKNKYTDRKDAGAILAKALLLYKNNKNAVVLALPRGGVPVAFEVATTLNLPLDIFIVRKLGVPHHEELAMGAIALGGTTIYNKDIVTSLNISPLIIENVIAKEKEEIQRRNQLYRGNKPLPALTGKTIIIIDDGIATGATIRAAIAALKTMKPKEIIVAVPVADISICQEIASLVDEFVCPLQVTSLYAVGMWYDNFEQTEDEEVYRLLNKKYFSV